MPFYLSEYIGSGTRADPFRPVGADQPGWTSIDIRPDASRLDGGGLNACLLHVPAPFADARARFLADDKLESLTNPQKNFLTNKLGVDLSSPTLLRDIVATLLTSPPANGWKALTPGRLRWEIHLGGLLWEAPRASGGASDNFNRPNENPIAAPWTKAGGGNLRIVSFQLTSVNDEDCMWYYSGAATDADQYCQCLVVTANGDGGPACRINADVDMYTINHAIHEYARILNNTFQSIGACQTFAANTTSRLEVEGSTIRHFVNGSPDTTNASVTDSNITLAGLGVGMFIFNNDHLFDDWEGDDLVEPGGEGLAWIRA